MRTMGMSLRKEKRRGRGEKKGNGRGERKENEEKAIRVSRARTSSSSSWSKHAHVDDSGKQVGQPEADVVLGVSGGELEEGTDVDAPVEDEHVLPDGDLGIDDDPLAVLLRSDDRALDGRLVAEKRAEGRLDEAGGEGEDDDGDDKGSESVAAGDDLRDGWDDEDNVGDEADEGSDADARGWTDQIERSIWSKEQKEDKRKGSSLRLESTPLGVSDDTSVDRNEVSEEGKDGGEGARSLETETESSLKSQRRSAWASFDPREERKDENVLPTESFRVLQAQRLQHRFLLRAIHWGGKITTAPYSARQGSSALG
jgi:hypothetical protein